MIAPPVVECSGAPRDLGLDQGEACREWLRRARRRGMLPREAVARPAGLVGVVGRDLLRHYAHLSERLEGLSLGARLPRSAFVSALCDELSIEPFGRPGANGARLGRAHGADGGTLLACSLEVPVVAGAGLVRRSRPEAGWRSIEWTLPWLPGAVCGVNERGLAATVVSLSSQGPPEGCAAPAPLLVQQCLERFEDVNGALDWCERRPAGGRALLVFADACGALGGLDADQTKRGRLTAVDGRILLGCHTALRERLRGDTRWNAGSLCRALAPEGADRIALVCDPKERSLTLQRDGDAPVAFSA